MQQSDKINYSTCLIHRADETVPGDEHILDQSKVKEVAKMVAEYEALKAREREQEDREFSTGAHASAQQ